VARRDARRCNNFGANARVAGARVHPMDTSARVFVTFV